MKRIAIIAALAFLSTPALAGPYVGGGGIAFSEGAGLAPKGFEAFAGYGITGAPVSVELGVRSATASAAGSRASVKGASIDLLVGGEVIGPVYGYAGVGNTWTRTEGSGAAVAWAKDRVGWRLSAGFGVNVIDGASLRFGGRFEEVELFGKRRTIGSIGVSLVIGRFR